MLLREGKMFKPNVESSEMPEYLENWARKVKVMLLEEQWIQQLEEGLLSCDSSPSCTPA